MPVSSSYPVVILYWIALIVKENCCSIAPMLFSVMQANTSSMLILPEHQCNRIDTEHTLQLAYRLMSP